jgi:hypothetical protein
LEIDINGSLVASVVKADLDVVVMPPLYARTP